MVITRHDITPMKAVPKAGNAYGAGLSRCCRRSAGRFLSRAVVLAVSTLLLTPQAAIGEITPQDAQALEQALDIHGHKELPLPQRSQAYTLAIQIMGRTQHTAADWQRFFSSYWTRKPLLEPNVSYLTHAFFIWHTPQARHNLRLGALPALMRKIQQTVKGHSNDFNGYMATNPLEREDFISSVHLIAAGLERQSVQDEGWGSPGDAAVYRFSRRLIAENPGLFSWAKPLDPKAEPWSDWLRLQVFILLHDTMPNTTAARQDAAQLIGLPARRLPLWLSHGVIMYDYNTLTDVGFDYLQSFYDTLPPMMRERQIHRTLDNVPGDPPGLRGAYFTGSFSRIGGLTDNPFPDDVPARVIPGFCGTVIHETGHCLHGLHTGPINRDPEYHARVKNLISTAGRDRLNYLRSLLDDGFFADKPWEFVASLTQVYWTDTEHTLSLGIKRLEKQRYQPLEQFLFLVDVLSNHGTQSYGYRLDTGGKLAAYRIGIKRDAVERIQTLSFPNAIYSFTYRPDGRVSAVQRR